MRLQNGIIFILLLFIYSSGANAELIVENNESFQKSEVVESENLFVTTCENLNGTIYHKNKNLLECRFYSHYSDACRRRETPAKVSLKSTLRLIESCEQSGGEFGVFANGSSGGYQIGNNICITVNYTTNFSCERKGW